MRVLVTGGTGFIGPKVIHALRARGADVRALVHTTSHAARIASLGVETVDGDVTDAGSLARAVAGCTHVVHLVAIIKGRPADFERVMGQGTRNVVDAAKAAGVERFVLMSALGTSAQTSPTVPYYTAKREMERTVRESELEQVIFRPSFVFGRDGGALPTFIRQVRYSPVVTVIGPGTQRSQPIWVDDVAAYFAAALDSEAAAGRTFELGGPNVVSWNELYLEIARALGKRRALAHVPFGLARAGARLTQWIPGAPVTADQVEMLAGPDNVAGDDDATDTFHLPLVPLVEQLRRAA